MPTRTQSRLPFTPSISVTLLCFLSCCQSSCTRKNTFFFLNVESACVSSYWWVHFPRSVLSCQSTLYTPFMKRTGLNPCSCNALIRSRLSTNRPRTTIRPDRDVATSQISLWTSYDSMGSWLEKISRPSVYLNTCLFHHLSHSTADSPPACVCSKMSALWNGQWPERFGGKPFCFSFHYTLKAYR